MYRLGNMMMLETSKNRDAGNQPYEIKQKIYQTSSLDIAKNIADSYKTWSQSTIDSRQQQMAKQATGIWKIAQLSG